jgi:bacterioferritin
MGAAHPRVLGYLGRALSLELSAVQQYMTQASLVELWGDTAAAERFPPGDGGRDASCRTDCATHAQPRRGPGRFSAEALQPRPDLAGLLRLDAALEADLIQHYAEAVRFCVLIGDAESEAFFRTLWSEEAAPWRGSGRLVEPARCRAPEGTPEGNLLTRMNANAESPHPPRLVAGPPPASLL